jgi:hypothetical protein
MSANHFDVDLDDLQRQSTGRLLSSETFDYDGFRALREHICRKAEQLRGEFVVSKQLLACLRGASGAIRNQAEHVAAARDHLAMADDFELLLDLIIAGEGCDDRQPGVPRII